MDIFDSHAHYLSDAFDDDRDQQLSALFTNGVCGIVEAATDVESSKAAIALAERYPSLYAAVGYHPECAAAADEDGFAVIERLRDHPKAVAVGEIGLDYHYDDGPAPDVQKAVFSRLLTLANDRHLPVVVHDRDAHEDTLQLLKTYKPRGVVHCFSGSVEMAREVLKLGMSIGIGGVVTFKNARKLVEVAQEIPLDRLLLETDAPYLAPVPLRGHRCDSSMIFHTAATIAAIRGITTDEVLSAAEQNARELFGL